MEWRDEGLLITMRRHGEAAAIIEVFTAAHGRHAGVVPGGASRKQAAHLQPGTQVSVAWRARLDQHMGSFAVEPLRSRAGLMADPLGLAGLNAICAMTHAFLPERVAQPRLYLETLALLDRIEDAGDWAADYLRWEMLLLEDLGFALDLARCAVTGSREDLAYVSPRTGRAVSRGAAGDWAPRLLALPPFLLGQGRALRDEIAPGFVLTGHFLTRVLAELRANPALPEARARLLDLLHRHAPS